MTLWSVLLILLVAVAALVLSCSMSIRFQRKHPTADYDERQEAFQGKAYGFGLTIGGIYFVILSFWFLVFSDAQLSGEVLSLIIMAGIMFTGIAVNLYCMMTGALLPLNGKANHIIALSCVMAGLELVRLAVHIWFQGVEMRDDPAGMWESMIGIVFWSFQAVIYLIAKRRNKRGSDGQ